MMRIHHLDCGPMRPPGGALMDGISRGPFGRLTCHCLAIETGGEGVVLVDTGLGLRDVLRPYARLPWANTAALRFRFDPERTMIRQLKHRGLSPRDVRHIVVTHLDFDHAGGLLVGQWPDELALAFPGVPVSMLDAAIHWARAADPDARLNVGSRLVALLEREGLLDEVGDGEEAVPGARFRSAPGHRAGHAVVELDGDVPFVHAADVLHHTVHAEHPEWDFQADDDPELALETRRRLLGGLAWAGARFVVAHVPGPHALRLERAGTTYRIVPA